jgi:hypothetical protein
MPLSKKYSADSGQSIGQYFQIGRVKSVVMGPLKMGTNEIDKDYTNPSDIGKIKYELLYSSLGTSKSEFVSEAAYPIFSFVKHLPLINEIVLIIIGPTEKLNDRASRQQQFYFPPFDTWNHVNHGAFPNMKEYSQYLSQFANIPSFSGNAVTGSVPLGYTFIEKPNIKNLKPFEGDTILQARFGQSIRFGSTNTLTRETTWSDSGNEGDPITIIQNSQGKRILRDPFAPIVEDINIDGSAIYLTSTQQINLLDINNFPLASFDTSITPITKAVYKIPRQTISNEINSANFQDSNTLS